MTTFGDQVLQFGGAPVAGALSFPIMGGPASVFFVDPANGSDSLDGSGPGKAFDTVGTAYGKTTDTAGDVIYLLNDGNTTGTSRESTIPLTWSNDNTHLIGCCAPTMVSQRARITPASGAALTANPVITVSGHGNVFKNLQIGHWGSTDSIASRGVDVTGNRNYFENCHFIGISHANVGDEATACDVLLTGSENTFVNCYFGIDTVTRSTTNANLEISGNCARNIFKGCFFAAYADNAGALFIKVDGSLDIDRFMLFDNCIFYNAVASGATTMTAASDVHASAGGMLIMKDCVLIGASDWEAADSTNIYLMCHTTTDGGDVAEMGIAKTVDVTE